MTTIIKNEMFCNEILDVCVVNKDAFRYCEREANQQKKEIQRAITKSSLDESSLPSSVKKQIKDFQRHVAVFSGEQFYQVQDPPLAFESLVQKGEVFNTNKYKGYTTSGDRVAFVVWPPLLLHENGPVLCKGIAQGITIGRNKISEPSKFLTQDSFSGNMKTPETGEEKELHKTHSSDKVRDVPRNLLTKEKEEGIELFKNYNTGTRVSQEFVLAPVEHRQSPSYKRITTNTAIVEFNNSSAGKTPSTFDFEFFFRWRERYGKESARRMIGPQKYDDIRYFCIKNGLI